MGGRWDSARASGRVADVHHQLISRGADSVLFPLAAAALWFGEIPRRRFAALGPQEWPASIAVAQLGEVEVDRPRVCRCTKVAPEVCILYTHDNRWTLKLPQQPNKFFALREPHPALLQRISRQRTSPWILRGLTEDLSRYRLVICPPRCICCAARRRTTSSSTSRTAARSSARSTPASWTGITSRPTPVYPHNLTDLFDLEVVEFDMLPPSEKPPHVQGRV